LDALFEGRFAIAASGPILEEFHRVLSLPKFVDRHGFTPDETTTYLRAVTLTARIVSPVLEKSYPVRDITDREFLSLAVAADADFLVTNDRRHLLPLKSFGRTRIVTPAAFLRHLK
jgi:putative PIN family toxin of toxin-antitoxin system